MYPKNLEPNSFETIRLFSGEEIQIPKATPCFEKWSCETLADTYGNKTILNFNGEAVFAELAILRIFQKEGWSGVWVDTYRRKYRTEYWNSTTVIDLPSDKKMILDNIYKVAGSIKGCWDVFCWKEESIIFAESKRLSKDKIRETQIRWLEAALNYGLNKETSFLIVEWHLC
ncbi:MAG TPA: hypothetical protein VF644_21160 [Pyrinomonadaceae bacterium]|jgi:hypothetical protein